MKLFKQSVFCVIVVMFLVHAVEHPMAPEDHASTLVEVTVTSEAEIQKLFDLGMQVEMNRVQAKNVTGFVSIKGLEALTMEGFTYKVIEPPQSNSGESYKPWYSFNDVVELFDSWEKKYADMTTFDTVGYSLRNKPVLQFTVFGAPATAMRQRIYFSGACHGNEKIGTETCMMIIDHLLKNYSSDQKVKELVDRSEFVFHPILNIDGFTASQRGRRTLDNGRDPNRAFGWKMGGKGSDRSLPYQWPTMKAYFRCMVEAPWYLSLDYHAGMKATLDPFFAPVSGGVMDKAAYDRIGEVYPAMPMKENQESYYIFENRGGGIGCDGAYGKCGNISILPEQCNHYPPEREIENIAKWHMDKFLAVIKEMQKGVSGKLVDARDGSPVYGRVQVKEKGAGTYSDPRSGSFFKYLPYPSGSFEVSVFANGYKPATKTVQSNANGFAQVEFKLEYDSTLQFAALSADVVALDNEISQKEVYSSLLSPDGSGAKIEGYLIWDFGAKSPITDQPGDKDLTIHGLSGSYSVSIHNDVDKIIDDEGVKLGNGQGKTSFDLSSASIKSGRWVRIDSDNSATIDAIEAAPKRIATAIVDKRIINVTKQTLRILPHRASPLGMPIEAFIPQGAYSLSVYDLMGRPIQNINKGYAQAARIHTFVWDCSMKNGRHCSAGTYLILLSTDKGTSIVKGQIVR